MDNELVQLAEIYVAPGFLLLASGSAGERLGCVGLRSLGAVDGQLTGEIRRLFVRGAARGQGLGAALTQMLRVEAGKAGFARLVLNTLPAMHGAIALYEGLGFEPSVPYVDEPLDDTLYLSLSI